MPIIAFMLRCTRRHAAMQTNTLPLASGIHNLGSDNDAALALPSKKEAPMSEAISKTTSIGLVPSTTFFGRLLVMLDRALMASARAAIRNGDLSYFGL
jgi:hypothetical protein